MKLTLIALSLTLLAACAGPHHGTPDHKAVATVAVPTRTEVVAETTYNVVPLKYAEASYLARVLTNAVQRRSDQAIVADARTNSLIVTCYAGEFDGIQKLIAALDVPVQKP